MNATRAELTREYNRAKKLGWIPHFLAAEKQHTRSYFDAADLMGIGSRETNLDPKWLTKAGDGGHGYGLMQADDRSFPGWIDTGEWKKAESGIHKGAEILMMKWHDMDQNAGKTLKVKGNTFKSPKLSGFKAQQAVISSYNCGRWALYCAAKGYDVDRYTTGKDYSSDVIGRAAIFRELLRNDGLTNSTTASPATSTPAKNSIENSEDSNLPDREQSSNDSATVQQTQTIVEGDKGTSTISETKVTTDANVAVGKEEHIGFFASIWKKLTGAAATVGGASALTDTAQQAQTFGLSPHFWQTVFIIIAVGVTLWIIVEAIKWFFGVYLKRKRTEKLAELNSTPNNTVVIVPESELDAYKKAGWVVIRRNG